MKLLLDTCVWGGAKAVLEAAGYDVVWSGDWEQDPGDEEIMVLARRDQRILITLEINYERCLSGVERISYPTYPGQD